MSPALSFVSVLLACGMLPLVACGVAVGDDRLNHCAASEADSTTIPSPAGAAGTGVKAEPTSGGAGGDGAGGRANGGFGVDDDSVRQSGEADTGPLTLGDWVDLDEGSHRMGL